ncbi:MAG TPA: energy transducer TonB [Opitutaceae bacterium]|nr:energy transducer TonB [Opitutaceae bacterium]
MKTTFILAALLTSAIASQAQPINLAPSATEQPELLDPAERVRSLVILRALKTETFVPPEMSAAMQVSVVTKGRVRVAVRSDSEGKPVDWIILAYSHRDLATSTTDVLQKWRFAPVAVDGMPISAQTEFDIEFKGPDIVSISPVMDQLEFFMRNMGMERLEYRPAILAEIDRIPLLLNVIHPRYSIAAREEGMRGTVEIQFYIDEEGTVRLPAIKNADRFDLAESALEAVRQWKFEPPTRNGRPVLITAVQLFDFGNATNDVTQATEIN